MNNYQKMVTRTIKASILGLSFLTGILSAQAQSVSSDLANVLKIPLVNDHITDPSRQSTALSGSNAINRSVEGSDKQTSNSQLLDLPAATGAQMPSTPKMLTNASHAALKSSSNYEYD